MRVCSELAHHQSVGAAPVTVLVPIAFVDVEDTALRPFLYIPDAQGGDCGWLIHKDRFDHTLLANNSNASQVGLKLH